MKKKHDIEVQLCAFFWWDIHTRKKSRNTIERNERLLWAFVDYSSISFLKTYSGFSSNIHPSPMIRIGPGSSKAICMFYSPARRNGSQQACEDPDPNHCEPQTLGWEPWQGDSLTVWTWRMKCCSQKWS